MFSQAMGLCHFSFRTLLAGAVSIPGKFCRSSPRSKSLAQMALVGQARTEIEASKFEEMEWALFEEKFKSDVQAVLMYRSKVHCHEVVLRHAKVQHTLTAEGSKA